MPDEFHVDPDVPIFVLNPALLLQDSDREILAQLEQRIDGNFPYLSNNNYNDLKRGYVIKNFRIVVIKITDIDLGHFPSEIRGLSSLEILWLSNCQIKELPEYLKDMTSLTILGLSNNNIKSIPNIFKFPKSLLGLDVSQNPLDVLNLIRLENRIQHFKSDLPEILSETDAMVITDLYISEPEAIPKRWQDLLIKGMLPSLRSYILAKLPAKDKLIRLIEEHFKIPVPSGQNILL